MNLLSLDKHLMAWRIEDELKKKGANYIQAGLWRGSPLAIRTLLPDNRIFQVPKRPKLLFRLWDTDPVSNVEESA